MWGPSRGGGKGKQAAVVVTYINASPADVTNGFAFTPLCMLQAGVGPKLRRIRIDISGGSK